MDYSTKISNVISNYFNVNESYIKENLEEHIGLDFGDYTLPCYKLSKSIQMTPIKIAQQIKENLVFEGFEKIEVCGVYLNFYIAKQEFIKNVLYHNTYRKYNKCYYKEKICIGYLKNASSNQAELNNLFINIVGSSLYRINNELKLDVVEIRKLRSRSVLNSNNILNSIKEKGLLSIENNAKVINLKEYNLPPLILESEDNKTKYICEYIEIIEKNDFDKLLYIETNDKKIIFTQSEKVLEKMGYDTNHRLKYILVGNVKLNRDFMFIEANKIITFEDILCECIKRMERFLPDILLCNSVDIRTITMNFFKFSLLLNPIEKDYCLDFKTFSNKERNKTYRVFYMYEKLICATEKIKSDEKLNIICEKYFYIAKKIYDFNYILNLSIENNNPNILADYIGSLVEETYRLYKEINNENELVIIKLSIKIIKKGFYLLGIEL